MFFPTPTIEQLTRQSFEAKLEMRSYNNFPAVAKWARDSLKFSVEDIPATLFSSGSRTGKLGMLHLAHLACSDHLVHSSPFGLCSQIVLRVYQCSALWQVLMGDYMLIINLICITYHMDIVSHQYVISCALLYSLSEKRIYHK